MTSVLALAAPLLLLVYYVVVYFALGTDRHPQSVVPEYQPPQGLSPAVLRYIWRGAADARTVAAIFAALNGRRLISLQKNGSKYAVKRLFTESTPLPGIPHEENTVLDFLFANFYQDTVFDPGRQSQGCASVIQSVLDKNTAGRYTSSHAGYVGFGVLGSWLFTLLLLATGTPQHRLLDCVISFALIGITAMLGPALWQSAQQLLRDLGQGIWPFRRLFVMAMVLGFVVSWFVLAAMKLRPDFSWNLINAIFAMALLNVIVQPFLRRDTEEGDKLKRQIEGFRAFLLTVEQDQLNRMNVPHKDVTFSGHLAYAVALEVKEAWGDYLANAFSPV